MKVCYLVSSAAVDFIVVVLLDASDSIKMLCLMFYKNCQLDTSAHLVPVQQTTVTGIEAYVFLYTGSNILHFLTLPCSTFVTQERTRPVAHFP